MFLFTRYIKSATFNTPISQRTERVLMLVFFSIWVIALIPTLQFTIQAIKSVPLYFESIKLKEKYQSILTENRQKKEDRESTQRSIAEYQNKNPPKTGLSEFVNSIDKGVHNPKPIVSKKFQKQQSIPVMFKSSTFDLQPWKDVGIDDPDPDNDRMPNEAISINSDNITSGIAALILYTLLLIVPWVLMRVFFWIKTANTTPV